MKILKIILKVIGALLIVILIAGAALWGFVAYKNSHYWKFEKTGGPIEAKYMQPGPYNVKKASYDSKNSVWKDFVFYFPENMEELERLPVVIMVNGTGIPESKYSAVFRQLASWGFIVAGNQDPETRSGESTIATCNYLLQLNEQPDSLFYQKVDQDHIGLTGHSQGGVGVFNAVSKTADKKMFSALYLASPTSPFWYTDKGFGESWYYNPSDIQVPVSMMAGTGSWDAGTATNIHEDSGQGICPLYALEQNYDEISNEVPKMISRQVGMDHGQTLYSCTGYRTAWFMYWLQNDQSAGRAFVGADAEILENKDWTDVERSEKLIAGDKQ